MSNHSTTSKITPQRRYQLARLAEGKCRACGEQRAPGDAIFCKHHREEHQRTDREWRKAARAKAKKNKAPKRPKRD